MYARGWSILPCRDDSVSRYVSKKPCEMKALPECPVAVSRPCPGEHSRPVPRPKRLAAPGRLWAGRSRRWGPGWAGAVACGPGRAGREVRGSTGVRPATGHPLRLAGAGRLSVSLPLPARGRGRVRAAKIRGLWAAPGPWQVGLWPQGRPGLLWCLPAARPAACRSRSPCPVSLPAPRRCGVTPRGLRGADA